MTRSGGRGEGGGADSNKITGAQLLEPFVALVLLPLLAALPRFEAPRFGLLVESCLGELRLLRSLHGSIAALETPSPSGASEEGEIASSREIVCTDDEPIWLRRSWRACIGARHTR